MKNPEQSPANPLEPANQPSGSIEPKHTDPVILMAEQFLQTLEAKIQKRLKVAKIPDDVPRFDFY